MKGRMEEWAGPGQSRAQGSRGADISGTSANSSSQITSWASHLSSVQSQAGPSVLGLLTPLSKLPVSVIHTQQSAARAHKSRIYCHFIDVKTDFHTQASVYLKFTPNFLPAGRRPEAWGELTWFRAHLAGLMHPEWALA